MNLSEEIDAMVSALNNPDQRIDRMLVLSIMALLVKCKSALEASARDAARCIVPKEPTEAMRLAGCTAIQDHYRGDGGWCGLLAAQEQMMLTWNAMINAALASKKEG